MHVGDVAGRGDLGRVLVVPDDGVKEGRARDARATVMDAVRLWDELVGLDPDRNGPPLAPAVLRALGRAGVDFSVQRPALLSWLGDPVHTP